MIEAYIDSLKIHDYTGVGGFGIKRNNGIKGLESPDIRLPTRNRPILDGAIIGSQLYGGRLVSWEGRIKGSTVQEYLARREQFIQAVRIKRDTNGDISSFEFRFTTLAGKQLMIEAYTKALKFPHKDNFFGDYAIDIFSQDPYIYSQVLNSVNVFLFSGGGMAIPTAIPLSMANATTQPTEVINEGNEYAYPEYRLYGPLNDPTIVNDTTGEILSIDYTLSNSDQFIVIDTKYETVQYYADAFAQPVNIRQFVSGEFPRIRSGTNYMKLTNTSYNTSAYMNIQYRHTYSGV